MKRDVHIGTLILHELTVQRRSASWLAEQLSCDRTNVYKIFKKKDLDTQLLLRISLVLDKDFFSIYTTILKKNKAGADSPPHFGTR